MFLNFHNLEPKVILKLLLSTKAVCWPENERKIFRSLLMS